MKTSWKFCFIILGLLIFAGGCGLSGGVAMFVQFFGAIVMMVGLLPIIDKELFSTFNNNTK